MNSFRRGEGFCISLIDTIVEIVRRPFFLKVVAKNWMKNKEEGSLGACDYSPHEK
jgi:hypothetical protein